MGSSAGLFSYFIFHISYPHATLPGNVDHEQTRTHEKGGKSAVRSQPVRTRTRWTGCLHACTTTADRPPGHTCTEHAQPQPMKSTCTPKLRATKTTRGVPKRRSVHSAQRLSLSLAVKVPTIRVPNKPQEPFSPPAPPSHRGRCQLSPFSTRAARVLPPRGCSACQIWAQSRWFLQLTDSWAAGAIGSEKGDWDELADSTANMTSAPSGFFPCFSPLFASSHSVLISFPCELRNGL